MEHRGNYDFQTESDNVTEAVKKAFEQSIWRQRVEKYHKKSFKQLSLRKQYLIQAYINWHIENRHDERDVMLVNEIRDGRISLAYEGLQKFPRTLVVVLRDITHLDLTKNNIRNFEFLHGFKNLITLIVDENIQMDIDSFPPINTLEVFYANKCRIEYPRAFVTRTALVFPSLKYFSMMYNPIMKRNSLRSVYESREHRWRMLAIFINPNLVHLNDSLITQDERRHANDFHKYLGPIDCTLSKFKASPDTDDLKRILPLHIRKRIETSKPSFDDLDKAQGLEEALAAVNISAYFACQHADNSSTGSHISSDKEGLVTTTTTTRKSLWTNASGEDSGVGFLAPRRKFYD